MKFLFQSIAKIGQDESADEESLTIGRCRRTGDLTVKVGGSFPPSRLNIRT